MEAEINNLVNEFKTFRIKIIKDFNNIQLNQDEINKLKEFLFIKLQKLLHKYITEKLENWSDICYNDDLIKYAIAEEDYSDIIQHTKKAHNYINYRLRVHIRNIMSTYIDEIYKAHPINITDNEKLNKEMKFLGVRIYWSEEKDNKSLLPDGNVLVMGSLVLIMGCLFLYKTIS